MVQHRDLMSVDAEDVADYLQFTAIHCAIVFPGPGDIFVPHMLNDNMRDIATLDALGRTPLHWACATGSPDFVRALLNVNALPNSRDRAGMTPLHHACGGLAEVEPSIRLAICQALLVHGADVNAVDNYNDTPLHQAREAETSQLLLDHGARVDALDLFHRTPLFNARDAAQVDVLITNGARLADIDYGGNTAMHACISGGGVEVVQALIRRGADIYATDRWGATPFHEAIDANAEQILLVLREAQARDPVSSTFANSIDFFSKT